jgi:hypothetical protein
MSKKIAGDPKIVATSESYMVIKRGKYYGILREGDSLFGIRAWKDKKLLYSVLIKGGYEKVDPPKDYTEKEEK